jgi:hypothetical protein
MSESSGAILTVAKGVVRRAAVADYASESEYTAAGFRDGEHLLA